MVLYNRYNLKHINIFVLLLYIIILLLLPHMLDQYIHDTIVTT